jgi:hypothetical protein
MGQHPDNLPYLTFPVLNFVSAEAHCSFGGAVDFQMRVYEKKEDTIARLKLFTRQAHSCSGIRGEIQIGGNRNLEQGVAIVFPG